MGRKPKKKLDEMTELEHLQYENEYLKADNAFLKKLREVRLRDEIKDKKVQRLMTELGLKARVRAKHRYNFYKGEMGLRLNI